jgi:hypothetical protein
MCIWNSRWPPLQNYFKIILFWNPSDIQYGHHHMASQVPYKVFFLMCIWNSRWPPLQNYFKIILFWNPSDIQYGHHHKSLTKFFFLCASEIQDDLHCKIILKFFFSEIHQISNMATITWHHNHQVDECTFTFVLRRPYF